MAGTDPIIFNRDSAGRIKACVKAFEDGGDNLTSSAVNRNNYYDRTFFARISDNVSLGTGQWKYAWTEVVRSGTSWVDKTAARTGTTTDKYALNGAEKALFLPHPVATGVIVLMKFGIEFNDDGTTTPNYTFALGEVQPVIYVSVSTDGGTAGDDTTTASFTYTATDLSGVVLGTTLSPTWARFKGEVTAATNGTGYGNSGSGFVLLQVDEVPTTLTCET